MTIIHYTYYEMACDTNVVSGGKMELHNRVGEVARMADNLTLKEVAEMGFTIDLCDEGYDPAEHWTMEASSKGINKDNREE